MGELLEFAANGHATSGYLAVAASGRGPGLLVVQEWWGLVDHIKQVCDRFAGEGFTALAPDLYHGIATKSPDEAGKLLMALDIARAGSDLRGAAEALLARKDVSGNRVAALGFCMGGQLALWSAAQYPGQIGAAVDFYGIHPKVTIEPAQVRVPVLAHFAKRDKSVPEAEARRLVERIAAAGGVIEAHFYDADHAFFNDSRPGVFNRECAELAWTRTLDFLRRSLKQA